MFYTGNRPPLRGGCGLSPPAKVWLAGLIKKEVAGMEMYGDSDYIKFGRGSCALETVVSV